MDQIETPQPLTATDVLVGLLWIGRQGFRLMEEFIMRDCRRRFPETPKEPPCVP